MEGGGCVLPGGAGDASCPGVDIVGEGGGWSVTGGGSERVWLNR